MITRRSFMGSVGAALAAFGLCKANPLAAQATASDVTLDIGARLRPVRIEGGRAYPVAEPSNVKFDEYTVTVAFPDMEPGVIYCPRCDKHRFLSWAGPNHVASWFTHFMNRPKASIYLNGEQVLNAYEVLDGHWAILGAHDGRVVSCDRCRGHVAIRFERGPYEVRWDDDLAHSLYVQQVSNPSPFAPSPIECEWHQN